jgi:hypothetical protein
MPDDYRMPRTTQIAGCKHTGKLVAIPAVLQSLLSIRMASLLSTTSCESLQAPLKLTLRQQVDSNGIAMNGCSMACWDLQQHDAAHRVIAYPRHLTSTHTLAGAIK